MTRTPTISEICHIAARIVSVKVKNYRFIMLCNVGLDFCGAKIRGIDMGMTGLMPQTWIRYVIPATRLSE